jgi:hypothetical protein
MLAHHGDFRDGAALAERIGAAGMRVTPGRLIKQRRRRMAAAA